MLRRLIIQNYALIDALDISFPDGLVILTGETGAGKSILLGAISLLLGHKADVSIFNDDTRNCIVEAEFDDDFILRRVVSPSGRSRSFLNDEPVSLSALSEISNKIIDIHAQHQHLLLSDSDYQLSVLDYYADNSDLLSRYQDVFSKHKIALGELDALNKEMQLLSEDAEYREHQYKELEQAALIETEQEDLEDQQKLLSNAEEVITVIKTAIALLNPYETSITQNLKEASSLLARNAKVYENLDSISERLFSSRIELNDIELELNNSLENVVFSPEKLQIIEDRLSLIYTLLKKHNSTTIKELIQVKNTLDNSLFNSHSKSELLDTLTKDVEELAKKRMDLATELSQKRQEAAPRLSLELQTSIASLEMPRAEFLVQLLNKGKLTSSGGDSLNFMFSANGSKLGDISKVASGGELSRVMLSLKALMANYTSLPTMIFDEIDVGVSGRIADKMGDMIGEMGENMQIFAITHLPQIASKKGAHFQVYKEYDADDIARTKLRILSFDDRVEELARMLSGSTLSREAIENAKVLLRENNN